MQLNTWFVVIDHMCYNQALIDTFLELWPRYVLLDSWSSQCCVFSHDVKYYSALHKYLPKKQHHKAMVLLKSASNGLEKSQSGCAYKKIIHIVHRVPLTHYLKKRIWKGCSPWNHSLQVKRESVREAIRRQNVTLKELERTTAQMEGGVNWTTTAWTLHKAGLYERIESHIKSIWAFVIRHIGYSANM